METRWMVTHEHAEHSVQPFVEAHTLRCDDSCTVRDFGDPGLSVLPGETGVIHLGVMNPSKGSALWLRLFVETLEWALWKSPPRSGALERLGCS